MTLRTLNIILFSWCPIYLLDKQDNRNWRTFTKLDYLQNFLGEKLNIVPADTPITSPEVQQFFDKYYN